MFCAGNELDCRRSWRFSLFELMMVLTLILLAATIMQPIFQNIVRRARESVS